MTSRQVASQLAGEQTPTVLVGPDAEALGNYLRSAPDEGQRERYIGVMVGEPGNAAVAVAADQMAAELWQWAGGGASPLLPEATPP